MSFTALKRRLAHLEAQKAHVEGTRFLLNFAGRDAAAVRDQDGRTWTREPGETADSFDERIKAGHRPWGFICLEPAL